MSSYIVPLWLIEKSSNRNASLAIGQLMVVKRETFRKVDGLSRVANKICEDLQFARLLKSLGYKTKFILMEDYVSCNMYESFKDAFIGNYFVFLMHSIFILSILSFFTIYCKQEYLRTYSRH